MRGYPLREYLPSFSDESDCSTSHQPDGDRPFAQGLQADFHALPTAPNSFEDKTTCPHRKVLLKTRLQTSQSLL